MFGCEDERPVLEDVDGQELIAPVERFGVRMLSIGFFVNKESPVLWRGSMASNALKQLLTETNWGELDVSAHRPTSRDERYPSDAGADARSDGCTYRHDTPAGSPGRCHQGRGDVLDEHVQVPILGLVENMAWFTPAELPQTNTISSGVMAVGSWLKSWIFLCFGQIPPHPEYLRMR